MRPDLLWSEGSETSVWRARIDPARQADTARRALRLVLAEHLGADPRDLVLTPGENGKPRLAEGLPHFSLSHSGDLALIAVGTREVGVDLERIRPGRPFARLADRFLDAGVAGRVRSAPPRERAEVFYRGWVRHEARRKLFACREPEPPAAVEMVDLDPGRGWAAALAAVL